MPPVKSPSKTGKADYYAIIREMIVKRDVMPNERLIEADLAERFKTNRASIRMALARLQQEGLVVSEANRGARVRLVTEAEALEIFEVRGLLEVLIVQRAATQVKKKNCERFRELLDMMKAAVDAGDHGRFTRESLKLHEEIWLVSDHQTAIRSLRNLNSLLVRFRFQSITMPGRPKASMVEHEAVVAAICAGKPEEAARAMREYADSAIASLKRAFEIEKGG